MSSAFSSDSSESWEKMKLEIVDKQIEISMSDDSEDDIQVTPKVYGAKRFTIGQPPGKESEEAS